MIAVAPRVGDGASDRGAREGGGHVSPDADALHVLVMRALLFHLLFALRRARERFVAAHAVRAVVR